MIIFAAGDALRGKTSPLDPVHTPLYPVGLLRLRLILLVRSTQNDIRQDFGSSTEMQFCCKTDMPVTSVEPV